MEKIKSTMFFKINRNLLNKLWETWIIVFFFIKKKVFFVSCFKIDPNLYKIDLSST